jgi:Bacterial TSP3 repeat
LPAAALLAVVLAVAHSAGADLSHSGGTDPVLEGWVASGNLTGLAAIVQQIPTWQISDGSTAAGSALFYSAEEFPAPGEPWTIRARLRARRSPMNVQDQIDMGVFLEVTDSSHRRFLVQFGTVGPDGLLPDDNWVHLSPDGSSAPILGNAWPIGPIDNLVLVELASDGTTADLFVNGGLIFSGYAGFVQPSVAPRVLWGSGSSTETGYSNWADAAYVTGTQACSNGLDDDGNGLADALDPYCVTPLDPREGPPPVPCTDGVDTDSDGICDVAEPEVGTSPILADTDGDGINDGDELLAGTDPLDAQSPPPVPGLPVGGGWALVALLGLAGSRLARNPRRETGSQ